MNRVPDRKRQRREYLRKMRMAHTLQVVGALVYQASMSITVLAFVFALLMAILQTGYRETPWVSVWQPIMTGLIAGSIAFTSWWVRRSGERISPAAYVPPVTLSTLPVEEVLVRGAEQPAIPTETLLRAAQANVEIAPNQLLRVVPGTTREQER